MLSEEIRRLADMYAGVVVPLQADIKAAEAAGIVSFPRQDLATLLHTWADRVATLEVYKRLLGKITDVVLTDPEMVSLADALLEAPPPNDGSAA